MNDFEFGNYLSKVRREAGMSQAELAAFLNVTNKAVSKWENGTSKPSTEKLLTFAKLFNLSIEDLTKHLAINEEKQIFKFVITGGPCSGKTTAMGWIQRALSRNGFHTIFVPETATELILAGVNRNVFKSNYDFEKAIMLAEIAKEKVYDELAKLVDEKKIVLIYDRGIMDCKSYVTPKEFSMLLRELGLKENYARDRYDAVFHLVTAAKGAEEYYTLLNNAARTETPEQARALDDALIAAWTGHPHFRVIDNSTNFEDKLKRLIKEIAHTLGEPDYYEIERKFLIEYPNLALLESKYKANKAQIVQTYLKNTENKEIRIRQRGEDGDYVYTKTIKTYVTDQKRIEQECKITKEEYLNLLMNADPTKKQIFKTRYCLVYENQYFEIDVYPFWDNQAIMEIELHTENQEIKFPPEIKVIKEVTNDKEYKNYSLAKIK